MRETVVLILVGLSVMVGAIFVWQGVKRLGKPGNDFRYRQLFQNIPFSRSSGQLLIAEGLFIWLTAVVLYWVTFHGPFG